MAQKSIDMGKMVLIRTVFGAFILSNMVNFPILAETYRAKSGESLHGSGQYVISVPSCRLLLRRHVPDADVTYDAGRDAVAPADLYPQQNLNNRARSMAFAVRVVPEGEVPQTAGRAGMEAEGFLGLIDVRDGVAYFDGEPLDAGQAAALRDACGEVIVSDPIP